MTVKDLIKQLEGFDQDATIVISSGNFEHRHATIEATTLQLCNGKKQSERFRDGFDGEAYDKYVWRLMFGDTKCVFIS